MTRLQTLTAGALGAFIFRNTGPAGMAFGAVALAYVVACNRADVVAGPPPMSVQKDDEPDEVQATGAQPSVPGRWLDSSKGRIFIPDHR